MQNETGDHIAMLDAILEKEQAALLAGDFDKIAELLAEKETLIDALRADLDADPDRLTPVQTRLSHNQALLEGAMDGLRSVIDRMADLRRVRAGLDTYDRSGRRQTFAASPKRKLEKRA